MTQAGVSVTGTFLKAKLGLPGLLANATAGPSTPPEASGVCVPAGAD